MPLLNPLLTQRGVSSHHLRQPVRCSLPCPAAVGHALLARRLSVTPTSTLPRSLTRTPNPSGLTVQERNVAKQRLQDGPVRAHLGGGREVLDQGHVCAMTCQEFRDETRIPHGSRSSTM